MTYQFDDNIIFSLCHHLRDIRKSNKLNNELKNRGQSQEGKKLDLLYYSAGIV